MNHFDTMSTGKMFARHNVEIAINLINTFKYTLYLNHSAQQIDYVDWNSR